MYWFRKLRLRVRALTQKEQLDARMDEELRSHIEMQTQENIEAGMSSEEARRAALREFGWIETVKEKCRDQRGTQGLGKPAGDHLLPVGLCSRSPSLSVAGP